MKVIFKEIIVVEFKEWISLKAIITELKNLVIIIIMKLMKNLADYF
jgi:hypothetical protein